MENFGDNDRNPKCYPVNPIRQNVNLKNSDQNSKIYPYGIIFEFFKLLFAELILTRESRKPERLEPLYERQIHLLNNVVRPDHVISKKCHFNCEKELCELHELRKYHDK